MPKPVYLLPEVRKPTFSAILWRITWPVTLFSTMLAVLLLLSWTMLLPRYTRIEVSGTPRSAEEIQRYKASLLSEIEKKEEERRTLILALHDPLYTTLKEERRKFPGIEDVRGQLEEIAKTSTGKTDALHISALEYAPSEGILSVRGDIRNVGTRSMTVLAEFIDAIGEMPSVKEVTRPPFARNDDAAVGPHSPFSITITFQ